MKKIQLLIIILAFFSLESAMAQIIDKKVVDKIKIDNSSDKNTKSTIKTELLKPNLGGMPMVPAGNTVTLFPGNYDSYLWNADGSTESTFTLSGQGQCCNKVEVSDALGGTGNDQVSVTIQNPTVGFYNIEREEPYSCSDVIVLKAFNVNDAHGYIVPGFAITIRTDENSNTENKINLYRNGEPYGSMEVDSGTFTNNNKHYVNLQYINPENNWSFEFEDKGESGDFHIVTQDNCDWSTIERKIFSYSAGITEIGSVLGHAKGTATFSGPGVENHGNGYGRFYAQLAGPGTHTITYTWNDGRGFEGSASQTITVAGVLPTMNAGIDQTICPGDSVTLGATPSATGVDGFMFQWEPAEGLNDPYSANPVASPTQTTTYTGMVADYDGNGCVAYDEVSIEVNPFEPDTIQQNDTSICFGESLILSTQSNFSLQFDGNEDYVYTEDADVLDLTSAGTLEAWINPTYHQALGGIFHKGDLADWSDEAYSLQLWNDKRLRFELVGDGKSNKNSVLLRSDSKLELNTWYHVAAVWDANGMKLYINGQLDNSTSETLIPRVSTGGLNIGSILNKNYNDKLKKMPFNGFIDEARVWNRALSQSEIEANRFKSLDAEGQTGLVANYTFNEGVGKLAHDNSENELNAAVLAPEWSTNVPFGESQNTYNWSTNEQTTNIKVKPTETKSYTVTVSNENCSTKDTVTVSVGNNGTPSISGTVSYSSGEFQENDLTIKAYSYPAYNLVAQENINAFAEYNMDLPNGDYILRAVMNNANYPDLINTYYENTYSYRLADVLKLNCANNFVANINMVEIDPLPSQNELGSVSGTITSINSAKAGNKTIYVNKTGNKTSEIPLNGAIFTAEVQKNDLPLDINSNPFFEDYLFYEPKMYSQSDNNGFYTLNNLELGTYALQVNLPGFDMISTYEVTISEANLHQENLNFIVDGAIETSSLPTNISDFENETFSLKVFPNPVIDNFTLNLDLKKTTKVQIKLFSSTGKLLISSESENHIGNYSKSFQLIDSGIYILQVELGSDIYVRKIIK